jgi:hypothetical protein
MYNIISVTDSQESSAEFQPVSPADDPYATHDQLQSLRDVITSYRDKVHNSPLPDPLEAVKAEGWLLPPPKDPELPYHCQNPKISRLDDGSRRWQRCGERNCSVRCNELHNWKSAVALYQFLTTQQHVYRITWACAKHPDIREAMGRWNDNLKRSRRIKQQFKYRYQLEQAERLHAHGLLYADGPIDKETFKQKWHKVCKGYHSSMRLEPVETPKELWASCFYTFKPTDQLSEGRLKDGSQKFFGDHDEEFYYKQYLEVTYGKRQAKEANADKRIDVGVQEVMRRLAERDSQGVNGHFAPLHSTVAVSTQCVHHSIRPFEPSVKVVQPPTDRPAKPIEPSDNPPDKPIEPPQEAVGTPQDGPAKPTRKATETPPDAAILYLMRRKPQARRIFKKRLYQVTIYVTIFIDRLEDDHATRDDLTCRVQTIDRPVT